jgi:hypothetical protein
MNDEQTATALLEEAPDAIYFEADYLIAQPGRMTKIRSDEYGALIARATQIQNEIDRRNQDTETLYKRETTKVVLRRFSEFISGKVLINFVWRPAFPAAFRSAKTGRQNDNGERRS